MCLKYSIFLVFSIFIYSFGNKKEVLSQSETISHKQWDVLLKKHVDNEGNVDYKNFKKDSTALNIYLDHLADNSPTDDWSKNETVAYYINIYNAGTIKLIVDNYPVKSIKDIKNPWLKKRIRIGDREWSLGGIEYKILRKIGEPRMHFAINCASYSCPKLLNEAYTSGNIESQLQTVTIDFLKDTKRNRITQNRVQLSKIFKWYHKDFTKNSSLIAYINTLSGKNISNTIKIEYLEYDWTLNEKK